MWLEAAEGEGEGCMEHVLPWEGNDFPRERVCLGGD